MTAHSATQDHPDAPRPTWTCPTCSVEFKSFATWTRTDAAHYAEYRSKIDGRPVVDDTPTVPQDDVDYRPNHGTGSGRGSSPEKASEKQVAFLVRLSTERGLVDTPELRTAYANLTKRQASQAIDAMMKTPATVPATPTTTTTTTIRRNKFEGRCSVCRGPVAEMAGILSSENGRWIVRHDGPCPVVADAPAATRTPSSASVDVPDGYYAIESTGHNDLAFYAVSHSDRYGISVKMVVGGHVDSFVRRQNVAGIVERIAADVDGAAKRYADEIGNCYRCNRTLTDETSRALGIGPTCRARA